MRVTDTHVYFWGSFLSNFWWTNFDLFMDERKLHFNTSEQAFMAFKALQFGDIESFEEIMKTPDGKSAKAIGRRVKGFNAGVWDQLSYDRMYLACFSKFSQDKDCKASLLRTGKHVLVEASPVDKIWGVGLSEDDDRILNESNWLGENRLGKVLMAVRSNL